MGTRDARQAFLEHERLQETSDCKQYNSGALYEDITNFYLEDHVGTRMSFLTEWFNKYYQLNELAGGIYGYPFVRSTLQYALYSDNRLSNLFLSFQ